MASWTGARAAQLDKLLCVYDAPRLQLVLADRAKAGKSMVVGSWGAISSRYRRQVRLNVKPAFPGCCNGVSDSWLQAGELDEGPLQKGVQVNMLVSATGPFPIPLGRLSGCRGSTQVGVGPYLPQYGLVPVYQVADKLEVIRGFPVREGGQVQTTF